MKKRTYKFFLSERENRKKIETKTVTANSFQEATSEAYIYMHGLRMKTNSDWHIIKAVDTSHFKKAEILE